MTNEAAARKLFEVYCSEGVRPMMYNLTQTASGEYAETNDGAAWDTHYLDCGQDDGYSDI